MYELIPVGEKTYYIDCPAKMGIYQMNSEEVCLIDSGNDKEAGKKVLKILNARGWRLNRILNTHSHADHIGGNCWLQERTGCAIYAPDAATGFAQHPILNISYLHGGYPLKGLRNKFLQAQPSRVEPLSQEALPPGMEMTLLAGHAFSMAAFRTDDEVWFVGDCVSREEIVEKYHVLFAYHIPSYLESMERVKQLQGRLFIPSHGEPTADLTALVTSNVEKSQEIGRLLVELCGQPKTVEDVIKGVFDHYGLEMNHISYATVGSTLRSYLSYLQDEGRLTPEFRENRLYWMQTAMY